MSARKITGRGPALGAGLLLGLVALVAGCGPDYARTDLLTTSSPPLEVRINESGIELPEGVGVGIEARPLDQSGHDWPVPDDGPDDFLLQSADSSLLQVIRLGEQRRYLLLGRRTGQTELLLRVNGQEVERRPASVVAQSPAP